jgi:hypothetical protein
VSSTNNVESVGTVGTTGTKRGSGPNGPNDFDIVGGGQATARGVRDKTRTRVCALCGREGAAVTARNLRSTGVVWLHDGACLAEWRRPRLKRNARVADRAGRGRHNRRKSDDDLLR